MISFFCQGSRGYGYPGFLGVSTSDGKDKRTSVQMSSVGTELREEKEIWDE
jgi:hypothetical protein